MIILKKPTQAKTPAAKTTKAAKPAAKSALLDMAQKAPDQQKSGCCMGTPTCETKALTTPLKTTVALATPAPKAAARKGPKTRITIKYDVGFHNTLHIRGKGADLCWSKGIALKNIKRDEWVWETEAAFSTCEFKVLINDKNYELGENHTLACGANIQYTPNF